MGTGNSREWYGQRQESSFGYNNQSGKKRRNFFRRLLDTTTLPIVYAGTQPITYRSSSASRPIAEPTPFYAPMQPQFLPMPYNMNAAPSFMSPQPMMMPPAPPVGPYMIPPQMQMPYVQQAQMQPAYNNMQFPGIMPGGTGPYSSPYASIPPRLITDWTRGGVISPGFLGPPI
jgi:hypothetical protein